MWHIFGKGSQRGVLRGLGSSNPASKSSDCRRVKFQVLSAASATSVQIQSLQSLQSLRRASHPSTMELRFALVLFFCFTVPLRASDTTPMSPLVLEPYDFLFDTGVEAYYNGDWLSVILNMEKALKNKATVRKVKAQCRLSCANQTAFGDRVDGVGVPIPGAGSLEDLGFFQKILKRADCVNSCEMEKLGHPTMHQVTEEVQLEFNKRSPYNYLQVAYFKVGS